MDYILIAIICFLASYVGASMGSKGEVKNLNPVAPIMKKIAEKKQNDEMERQDEIDREWLYHKERQEE